MRLTVAVLVASMAPLAFAAESVSAIGTWTVTQVETDPTMPITAVVEGDPAYLGAELVITRSAMTWNTAATNGQGTFDDCPSPRFSRGGDGTIAVSCGGAHWGPEASLTPISANALRLGWYDGGVLILTRD